MPIFNIGIKIILVLIGIFAVVFFCLCYAWSAMHTKGERLQIATMLTVFYSFLAFVSGVLAVGLCSLIVNLWNLWFGRF